MKENETAYKIGKWKPPIHTQFKKWQKPPATPKDKSEWRDRRRQAQRMMDLVLKYQTMTKSDLEKLDQDKLTILELSMIKYVTSWMKDNKMLTDMIDRHISKAPQQLEHTGANGWDISISVKSMMFDDDLE